MRIKKKRKEESEKVQGELKQGFKQCLEFRNAQIVGWDGEWIFQAKKRRNIFKEITRIK